MGWLRDAVDITPLVELEIFLQMDGKVPRGIRGTGYARQGSMSTRRAKLLAGIFADFETPVAAEHPCLHEGDTRHSGIQEAKRSALY